MALYVNLSNSFLIQWRHFRVTRKSFSFALTVLLWYRFKHHVALYILLPPTVHEISSYCFVEVKYNFHSSFSTLGHFLLKNCHKTFGKSLSVGRGKTPCRFSDYYSHMASFLCKNILFFACSRDLSRRNYFNLFCLYGLFFHFSDKGLSCREFSLNFLFCW